MSSKRRIKRRSCTGKVRHVDSAAARKALRATVRHDEEHQTMNVYHCRFCGGYHIGHRSQRREG